MHSTLPVICPQMLYDNPQLASTYISAFQLALALEAAGNPGEVTSQELSLVVRGILDYLRRDMTHPEGGLYSAEVSDCMIMLLVTGHAAAEQYIA